ncbi:MAG: hypothetical protein ACOYNF_17230 [Rhodoferax sp.]
MIPKLTQGQIATRLSYGVVALFIALVIFMLLNQPIGPAEETTGTVQVWIPVTDEALRPSKNVWVRLSSGTVVVVNTHVNMALTPGQEINLLVLRRWLTNAEAYEVKSHGQK